MAANQLVLQLQWQLPQTAAVMQQKFAEAMPRQSQQVVFRKTCPGVGMQHMLRCPVDDAHQTLVICIYMAVASYTEPA